MKKGAWVTEGFEAFSQGTMGNGGQNLYVSAAGVLQRIFHYDVNLDGKPDLLFACSQSMNERPHLHIYPDFPNGERVELPSEGTFDGVFADLNGNGYDDLIVACQNNGVHGDTTSVIYYGSPDGLTERYRMELPAPSSVGVCVGDFNGDGRPDLAFLSCIGMIRVFYQQERGISPAEFTDYPITVQFAVAEDLDGDGYCDLLLKDSIGRSMILFGGPEGLSVENMVELGTFFEQRNVFQSTSTFQNIRMFYQWRPNVVKLRGQTYLFIMEGDTAAFYTCAPDRSITKVFSIECPNAVAAVAADFTGNGYEDLAIAVYLEKEQEADCRLYLGKESGLCTDSFVKIPVIGAANLAVLDLNGPVLLVNRMSEWIQLETLSPIFRFDREGNYEKIHEVIAGDCTRILQGYPQGRENPAYLAVMNHKMNRGEGHENIYIYLGSDEDYSPKRRIELPGNSAVQGEMVDFFDTGRPSVLVVNCFEDAPYRDHGSYIYTQDEKGFDPDRKVNLKTLHSHGAAVGDFRRSGYLDIAVGGFENREILIFHGSKDGFSDDNCSKVILGGPEGLHKIEKIPLGMWTDEMKISPEDTERLEKYGGVRWMLSADLNGDGWLDLVISEICGPKCFILWGGPEGFSWENRQELLVDGTAYAAVADLNGNGYPDLIISSHQSIRKNVKQEAYITVYWGGPEGYQEHRKMQLPVTCANSVTVGDYNGNGSLDIYATAYNNSRFRDILSHLYLGDHGDYSTRRVQYLFNHSGCGCVSGDFNGDGYTDLAVAGHKAYGNHASTSFIFWGGPDGLSEERKTALPVFGPHGMPTVDPGNIMDRGPREFYTSPVKEITGTVSSLSWEGECTSTSWVELQIRAAATEDTLSDTPWTDVENGADISALGLTGFVQYRLALCAKCSCGTPRIQKVTVTIE